MQQASGQLEQQRGLAAGQNQERVDKRVRLDEGAVKIDTERPKRLGGRFDWRSGQGQANTSNGNAQSGRAELCGRTEAANRTPLPRLLREQVKYTTGCAAEQRRPKPGAERNQARCIPLEWIAISLPPVWAHRLEGYCPVPAASS